MRMELPTIQNWSCHNCAGCCRQHLIEISEQERKELDRQKWGESGEIPGGKPVYVWHSGPVWKKRYRLAHQPDGACIFLNEKGLCRIHAKFGEGGKPLACRVYPYALHPAHSGVTVSLRFSCPSVIANAGRAVVRQRSALESIRRQTVPERTGAWPDPLISPGSRTSWNTLDHLVDSLDQELTDETSPFPVRLARTVVWSSLIRGSDFSSAKPGEVRQFLALLRETTHAEVPTFPRDLEPISSVSRLYFRTAIAQYARKDTVADLSGGWRNRYRLFKAIWAFTKGQGMTPVLQPGFREVPFECLEPPFRPPGLFLEELFTRYFRVKLRGLHFFGPAYQGWAFTEGWQSLVLIFPVVCWLARWLAVSEDRDTVTSSDLERAMAIADHHHGYSAALGTSSARRRIRHFVQTGDLQRLLFYYVR